MSTFGGKIEEIPEISVDKFDRNNFQSLAYFLSHCHSDHMVGLNNYFIQNVLLKENKFIYASDVSCVILKQMYPLIENNVKILDRYKPTMIMLKDKTICVTPLPAGHCPGSVMFLFENESLILYTGDYRIHKNDIRKLKGFYNSMNEIKAINKIYLDTTFFLKSYLSFPRRRDSLNELCKIIKEWTDKGKNYVVQLITSAKYGYEYIFNGVYKKIRMPVHVNENAFRTYVVIPEMDDSVTVEKHSTQIHSSCGSTYQSICIQPYQVEIRPIKISAFRWTQDHLEDGLSTVVGNVYYVCYSTHASYEEGLELIKFLKPKSIEACVKHDDPNINLEMQQLIDESLRGFSQEESSNSGPKLFGVNSICVEEDELENECGASFEDSFRILDSPPKESVEDIQRFLKKHSGSFSLDRKYKKLEITTESVKKVQKAFNFDDEFGIESSSSKVHVENKRCKSHKDADNDLIITEAKERDILNVCPENVQNVSEFKCKVDFKPQTEVVKAVDKIKTETDSFSKWILSSPPEDYTSVENKAFNNLDCTQDTKLNLTNVNEFIPECGSDLLREIYFLDPSPQCNGDTEKQCTKDEMDTKTMANNYESEDAFKSWLFNLSPDVIEANSSTNEENCKDKWDVETTKNLCESKTNTKSEKKLNNFEIETFDVPDFPSDIRNNKNYHIGDEKRPSPRKRPRSY